MRFTISLVSVLFGFSLFLFACTSEKKYIPDVSDIKTDVEIVRFDQIIMQLDTTKISEGINNLQKKHGDFVDLYFKQIVGQGFPVPPEKSVKGFRSIEFVPELYDSIQLVYPDLKDIEQDLEDMLRYYHYYFDKDSMAIDKIYTFFSLYSYGVFSLDNYIAVGLDFFLGEDHPPYSGIETLRYQYIRRTLNKEHLVAQAAYALATRIVEDRCQRQKEQLLDYMLYEGKKFYLVDSWLPNTPDSIKFGFSAYQMEYLNESEASLYKHLLDEQLFLSDNQADFRKYVSPGPFNPDINLPGNSGSWLGMQMLKSYIKEVKQGTKTVAQNEREADQKALLQMLDENKAQNLRKYYKPPK